jgi:hypothetical protein
LIDLNVKFKGFSLNGGANASFVEMTKMYKTRNIASSFNFQDFGPSKGPLVNQAKTVGDIVSATLTVCFHGFLRDVPAVTRHEETDRVIGSPRRHRQGRSMTLFPLR